jgi:hypothetical protein
MPHITGRICSKFMLDYATLSKGKGANVMHWHTLIVFSALSIGSAAWAQDNEPEPLSCEANFGCASGSQIPVGAWPDCFCQEIATPEPIPDPPDPPDPTVDPLPTLPDDQCSIHFQCEPGFTMLNWNGRCVCGNEVLPPPD